MNYWSSLKPQPVSLVDLKQSAEIYVREEASRQPHAVFQIAWGAHTILRDENCSALFSGSVGGFSPRLRLATLLLLEACCQQNLFPTEDPILVKSPLFPLLVQDSLESLSRVQNEDPNNDLVDQFMEFVESLVPHILCPERLLRLQGDLQVGDVTSMLSILGEAIQECISRYDTDCESTIAPSPSYVWPVVLARKDSEVADMKRLLESYPTDKATASAIMKPLDGIQTPFPRPLPPPMLPLLGCKFDSFMLRYSFFGSYPTST